MRENGGKEVQKSQQGGSYSSPVCLPLAILSMMRIDIMTHREIKKVQRQEQGGPDARGQEHKGSGGGRFCGKLKHRRKEGTNMNARRKHTPKGDK
jgi:hypothetical protein